MDNLSFWMCIWVLRCNSSRRVPLWAIITVAPPWVTHQQFETTFVTISPSCSKVDHKISLTRDVRGHLLLHPPPPHSSRCKGGVLVSQDWHLCIKVTIHTVENFCWFTEQKLKKNTQQKCSQLLTTLLLFMSFFFLFLNLQIFLTVLQNEYWDWFVGNVDEMMC